ncbi:hypothetical protein SapgrDRAFT_2491 [Saprospira grandis DSM 2844]|uniref:Uncharacterized protein n=1 Tax=Saprospira grandis DSM 2844 TaxID=694433 RepID=J1I5X4_9BACT|nr:hypothetical protein SapgrDRAFT_2491 [Saprospira grandis DSM 2844]
MPCLNNSSRHFGYVINSQRYYVNDLGPAASKAGRRYAAPLAGLLGPAALRALVWPYRPRLRSAGPKKGPSAPKKSRNF